LPATANQGTVYSVALYESPAGGNAWCYFNLPEPRDIATGDAMYIPESVLSIQFQTGIFSNYAKERILAMIFGSTVMPLASTYWVGYSTTAPSDQTPGAEPVGNGYSRVSIPNGLQMFPTSSSGIKTNGQDIVFPESTGNQGLAVGFEFYDAPGGGNRIAYHPSDPLAITNGVAPFIATGSIRFEVI
jgi:hypothetical protein